MNELSTIQVKSPADEGAAGRTKTLLDTSVAVSWPPSKGQRTADIRMMIV